MELDSSCFISQRYDEDGAHLFFKCKWARELWRELGWESVREQISTLTDVKQCVELLLALPNEKRSLLAMLLNNLWWERNRVRGGESRSPRELAWLTWRQSEECKELTKVHPGTRGDQQIPRWKRPPAGLLKINAGGFAQECGEGSWGFIIREENGEVVLAGAGKLNHVYEARQAELMACIQGARAAQTLSIQRIIVESDALLIKQALHSWEYRLSSMGGVGRGYELKVVLADEFSEARVEAVEHIPRQCVQSIKIQHS